jgi:competence protein ComEC
VIRPVLRRGPAPALVGAAVAVAGVWAGSWSVTGAVPAAALAVAAAGVAAGRRRRLAGALLALSLGFVLGRSRIAAPGAAAQRTLRRIDLSRPVALSGRIAGFWIRRPGSRSTLLDAEAVEQAGAVLTFPAPVRIWLAGGLAVPASRGDRIRAVGTLRRQEISPSVRDLPDPREQFRLSVKSAFLVRKSAATALSWISAPNRWLDGRLRGERLDEGRVRAPIEALLLGRTGELDEGMTDRFRRGGLYHLLVISGLHVALFAGLAALLLSAVGVRGRPAEAAVLAAVVGFAVFSGGRAPAMRAALTIAFLLVSRLIEKPVSLLQAAGVSALVVVAADPAQIFGVGFWLTYCAAIGIAMLTPGLALLLKPLPAAARNALGAAVAAQLSAAPLVAWRFNLVNGLAWLAAPIVLPVLSLLIVVGALVLAAAAAGVPAALAAAAFGSLVDFLAAIAESTGRAAFMVPTPPPAVLVLLLAALGGMAFASGRRARLGAAAMYAAALAFTVFRHAPALARGEFSVEALDVGQGDALLLRSGSGAFLVDGGGPLDGDDDAFGRVRLLPKLFDRRVVALDGVLLSHPHPDHALGLFAVLRDLRVGKFYRADDENPDGLGARLAAAARDNGVPERILSTGDEFAWAGGRFRILRAGGRFKTDPVNNASIVAIFEKRNRRVLLTGDAGRPAENQLLGLDAAALRADVLKVGHHGSRTSSGEDFLAAVSPKAALLSCGRGNPFGHPSGLVLANLARRRIPVYRTDLVSDVGFRLGPNHIRLFERGIP